MPRPVSLALSLTAAVVAGCRPAEPVQSYTAPKETLTTAPEVAKAAAPVAPPAAGTPARTLGVIVPIGANSSRFVKLTGAADAVDAAAADFRTFAQSLRVSNKEDKALEFQVPAGWRQAPARRMRQVTFLAGDPAKPVEVYISDVFGGDVLGNVNRWRGEVSQPDIAEADLSKNVEELKLPTGPAFLIDVRGTAKAGNMMRGPFQK